MRAIGPFGAGAERQSGCGDGCLGRGAGGIDHRAQARGFGGEGAKAVGVDLGRDQGHPKRGEGLRQGGLLAVHRAKCCVAGQGQVARREGTWLSQANPGR